MKKKIYYWSPCLNPVGTVKSTINSAKSLSKFDKSYDVKIINACGEWSKYEEELKLCSIDLINLNFDYFRFLPKTGYIQSRISYILIFIFSFFHLLKLLRKDKPEILIMHLITSLPMCILYCFELNTKFILRISGFPKLNFFRKFFWKKLSSKIYKITCPTNELKDNLVKKNIFSESKIFYLPDAIIDIKKFKLEISKKTINLPFDISKKIVLGTGRLTKQKNFTYLISEFDKFCKINNDFVLVILGDGEEKENLQNLILSKKLQKKVFLLGQVENVYEFMKISNVFVLSSLWEEVGFVIVEAALSNLFIISSNCPNGPTEFLDYGKNGNLFNSNQKNALFNSLEDFLYCKDKFNKKLKAKKNSLKYTKYRHFKILRKILD